MLFYGDAMSCNTGKYDICVRTGSDFGLRLIIKKGEAPIDLTGATLISQVRATAASNRILLDLAPQVGGDAGEVLYQIPAAQTDMIEFDGGVWDLRITLSNGETLIPLTGRFIVKRGVSRDD